MASARDVQDIMGMGGGPVKKPNKKKKRVVETQPRLSGISREVQALMGDSVPPVAIVETPKYKSKPTLATKLFRPRHWEERGYIPGARSDDLLLKHWKRQIPGPARQSADTEMTDVYVYEDDFPMEKWDISIRIPQYSEEQYEKHFTTDEWSKQETDYLMQLASDYDLRWIVIADRYDPNEIAESQSYPARTMEQLKLRYYQIAAADLELRTPKSNMNPQEFALYEKMRTFDAKTETARKAMAEKLFERTKDEAEEERTLLEELSRITKNEEEFISMRRDLYARLESAPSIRRNERGEEQNIHLTSHGLGELLSRLTSKDRAIKRRVAEAGPPQAQAERGARPSIASRRDTMDTTVDNKKASISAPTPKNLSKAEEERYGVAHPTERLTSGVSFRHEKINRITTAKSQVQTQKLNAALTELGIPARLSMPTEKVCKEFERLVGQIQLLLDARKTMTRVSEEVKILEALKRERLGEPNPDEAQIDRNTKVVEEMEKEGKIPKPANMDKPTIDEEDDDAEAEDDVEMSKMSQVDETIDESVAPTQNDDDGEEDAENEPDDAEAEEYEDAEGEDDDDEEEEDDEGMIALRKGARNIDADDEDAEGEEEEDSDDPEADEEDENDVEDSQIEEDVTMNEVEPAAGDPDIAEENIENSRPTSSGSRGHKRGASVVSDASAVGSNRSGAGRKRKR